MPARQSQFPRARAQPNNEMELTRSAMARRRGPRSSSRCSTDPASGALSPEVAVRFGVNDILSVLDRCCATFSFPMLDNGYVYLAATRLSLYRSVEDWAMAIEVFGFSPRTGLPDTHVHTFASRLHDRDPPDRYRDRQAYEAYLANNPNNESRFAFPIDDGPWRDENAEGVAPAASAIAVRGQVVALPPLEEYAHHGIALQEPPAIQVFELCRYLAARYREQVLATPAERRASVPPELSRLLQLEEWHHPNVVEEEKPSGSRTFRNLADVLVSGDASQYRPAEPPNTHWTNWPEGGSL